MSALERYVRLYYTQLPILWGGSNISNSINPPLFNSAISLSNMRSSSYLARPSLDRCNKMPTSQHDIDFSRVRSYHLHGQSSLIRCGGGGTSHK